MSRKEQIKKRDDRKEMENKEWTHEWQEISTHLSGGDEDLRRPPRPGRESLSGFGIGLLQSVQPMAFLTAWREHNNERFPEINKATERPYISHPHEGRTITETANDAGPAFIGGSSWISTPIKNFANKLMGYGDNIYQSLPALFPGVAADAAIPDLVMGPEWWPPEQKHRKKMTMEVLVPNVVNPTSTTTGAIAAPVAAGTAPSTTSPLMINPLPIEVVSDAAVILAGVNIYHQWSADLLQDERLKGIEAEAEVEAQSKVELTANKLLDSFAPIIPASPTATGQYSVNQYEYSVANYAISLQQPVGSRGRGIDSPARPQRAMPQADLQADVARLFFRALAHVDGAPNLLTLLETIQEDVRATLTDRLPLGALTGYAERTKTTLVGMLQMSFPSLDAVERSRLTALCRWHIDAIFKDIEPLFQARFNLKDPVFRETRYLSHEGALIRIGAAFFNFFPPKPGAVFTATSLHEAGLHCLIDLASEAWPRSVVTTLKSLGKLISKNAMEESAAMSEDDQMRAGLAHLIGPQMEKIALQKKVKDSEEKFLQSIRGVTGAQGSDQQLSKQMLSQLETDRQNLYHYGLAHLPEVDREKIESAARSGDLVLLTPKLTLHKKISGGTLYTSVFHPSSGLIVQVGKGGFNDPTVEFYLLSEESGWASSVASNITAKINAVGGIDAYVTKFHRSFTSGLRTNVPGGNVYDLRREIFKCDGGTQHCLDDLAKKVVNLQTLPPEIHKLIPPRPADIPHETWLRHFVHSKVYIIGKFIIGIIPKGSCVLTVLDAGEMTFTPEETDEGHKDQLDAFVLDSLFCFSDIVKLNAFGGGARQAVRSPFKYSSEKEFATDKVASRTSGQKHSEDSKVLDPVDFKPLVNEFLATPREDLHLRTSFSDMMGAASTDDLGLPDLISIDGNTLNVPSHFVHKAFIQKPESGAMYLIMRSEESEQDIAYLWNEAARTLERQTPAWLDGYAHLMDQDPLLWERFKENLPLGIDSGSISHKLKENRYFGGLKGFESHFATVSDAADRSIYPIGDRHYIKLHGKDFLLEKLSHPSEKSSEWRIVGESLPEDLRLDVLFDGFTSKIIKTHLITPVKHLPDSIVSLEEAVKYGLNLPEGWRVEKLYSDDTNGERFILEITDQKGNKFFRAGPNHQNEFEAASERESEICRVRRSDTPVAGCSTTLGPTITPITGGGRSEAMATLVKLEIETRPFHEQRVIKLEALDKSDEILSMMSNNPKLRWGLEEIIDSKHSQLMMSLPSAMKLIRAVGDPIAPSIQLLPKMRIFWKEMRTRLQFMIKQGHDFEGHEVELYKVCDLADKLSERLHTNDVLLAYYTAKAQKLEELITTYQRKYAKPRERLAVKLWRRIFSTKIKPKVTEAFDWKFEIQASGLDEIRTAYGANFATKISEVYSSSHLGAQELLNWAQSDATQFWTEFAKNFHVDAAQLSDGYKLEVLGIFKDFRDHSGAGSTDKLRIISPVTAPDGSRYRYNVDEHRQQIPQEANTFGKVIIGYSYSEAGDHVFLSTATFLSPTAAEDEFSQVLQHELSHFAIKKSKDEIYFNGARSPFGHCLKGSLRREAEALLHSPSAFTEFAYTNKAAMEGFLQHFYRVLPNRLATIFPEVLQGKLFSQARFKVFVNSVYNGPADDKVRAFMSPDMFGYSFRTLLAARLKLNDASGKSKRKAPDTSSFAEALQTLLIRDTFAESSYEKK
ncbi:hypothetical protein [Glaciimonas immobilis]|uniref:Uncharacterized protein n=1 Tax=Glaciimonas immobilis TaxID=728004 RepID=A0A840RPZ8_9BURK|nr:hypothetical protein [Glaciimonas immobilis]KAF3999322.1 hypothetical protein HAV38_05170 [Glaciimonas immobilis]MBB5198804.1 hypothetical protein [Glaciimonas immobilis]